LAHETGALRTRDLKRVTVDTPAVCVFVYAGKVHRSS
jgi:hypothetical protein